MRPVPGLHLRAEFYQNKEGATPLTPLINSYAAVIDKLYRQKRQEGEGILALLSSEQSSLKHKLNNYLEQLEGGVNLFLNLSKTNFFCPTSLLITLKDLLKETIEYKRLFSLQDNHALIIDEITGQYKSFDELEASLFDIFHTIKQSAEEGRVTVNHQYLLEAIKDTHLLHKKQETYLNIKTLSHKALMDVTSSCRFIVSEINKGIEVCKQTTLYHLVMPFLNELMLTFKSREELAILQLKSMGC